MADTIKKVRIEVDSSDAVNEIKKVNNELDNVDKNSSKATDGVKKVGSGFGGFVKALGVVGLLVTAFDFLVETLKQNEKVMVVVQKAMDVINSVFNAVVDTISSTISKVSELTNGFQSTGKVISGYLTIAISTLKIEFYAVMLAVKKVQLAWEESFFGKGRVEKINELKGDITSIKDEIVKNKDKIVQGGKDIYNNFSGMVKDFKTLGKVLYDESGKAIDNFQVKSQKATEKTTGEIKTGYQKLSDEISTLQTKIENAAFDGDIPLVEQLKKQLQSVIDKKNQVDNAISGNGIKKFVAGTSSTDEMPGVDPVTGEAVDTTAMDIKIAEAHDKWQSEQDQKALDVYKENIDKKADIARQGLEQLNTLSQIYTDVEVRRLDNKLKNGKISQEQYDKELAKIQKKAAIREKALAVGNAIINTAQAIVKTGAELGYPAAIPFQIAAGVVGAIQIAKIISTPVDGGSNGSVPSVSGGGGGNEGTAPNTSFSFGNTPKTTDIPPTKTYVISKDVENQQQLDRQIVANGTY